MDNHNKDQEHSLSKHTYPTWLLLGTSFVLLIYSVSLAHFINNDLQLYKELRQNLFLARKHFYNDQYSLAAEHLDTVFQKYPHSKLVQDPEATKLFELRKHSPKSFCLGMLRLENSMRCDIESYFLEYS